MSTSEIRLALELSLYHYRRRLAWAQEKEVLQKSLEERKWIEQAKGILSELKNIPEAEAYQFLRKQAMSERRKMTDVAKSIVNVYKLLQDSKRK
jgi:response regulator NasT